MNQQSLGRAIGGRWLGVAVAAVFMVASQASLAAETQNGERAVRSQTLHFKSAALDNPAGVQKMYTRLRIAAIQVCRMPGDEGSNGRAANACERVAMSKAVAQVNNQSLTSLHVARTGERALVSAWLKSPTPCPQCG